MVRCFKCGYEMQRIGINAEQETFLCQRCGSKVAYFYFDDVLKVAYWDNVIKEAITWLYDYGKIAMNIAGRIKR